MYGSPLLCFHHALILAPFRRAFVRWYARQQGELFPESLAAVGGRSGIPEKALVSQSGTQGKTPRRRGVIQVAVSSTTATKSHR